MGRNDLEYYQRRERQERDLARRADDPSVRRAHLTMAEHFEMMTRRVGGERAA